MSGHSEFAPIGNNPVVRMPPAGPVGDNAGQPENVPQIQPQAQPENAQADQPDARSLLQKLDTMLLKAAEMSTKAVDDASIKEVAATPLLNQADSDALAAAADTARQTMKAISDFTGSRELTALRTGERREAYLADLAKRLPPDAVDSARRRLDQAIDHALKLAAEYKVVRNGDFERRAMQKRLLEPEINAENPVKPVGDYQLPMERLTRDKERNKRLIVFRANINVKSFFMRDLYGKVSKDDWFR